jgi:hypothetical protein
VLFSHFVLPFSYGVGIHALDSTGQADLAKIVLYVVGAIVSIAVIALVTFFAKRAIDHEMKLEPSRRREERRRTKREVKPHETVSESEMIVDGMKKKQKGIINDDSKGETTYSSDET